MEGVDFLFEGADALVGLVEEFFVCKAALEKMEALWDGRQERKGFSSRVRDATGAGARLTMYTAEPSSATGIIAGSSDA